MCTHYINKECKCTHKVLLIKNVNVHTKYY